MAKVFSIYVPRLVTGHSRMRDFPLEAPNVGEVVTVDGAEYVVQATRIIRGQRGTILTTRATLSLIPEEA